jgi:sugar/nucleoside kinase (ribokinase family)
MNFDFDVIVLGDYCLDLIFTGLPSMPRLGEEIEAKGLSMEPGGACNTSLALHRLGVKTAWAVEFGTDDYSQFVLQKFRQENFPEDLFTLSNKPVRKITVSLSFPEERAFIAYYDQGEMIKTALKGLTTKNAKIIIIPSLFYGPAFQTGNLVAKTKHMDIFMDGNNSSGINLKDARIRNALKAARFYSPNSNEARRISVIDDIEKAAKVLGGLCQTVIIKDGKNGAWCCDNGNIYFEPAISVNAIDTTGAGDLFNAGFIKAWLDHKDIQECLKWGNIAGGLSTTKPGANAYRISSQEIENLIEKGSK